MESLGDSTKEGVEGGRGATASGPGVLGRLTSMQTGCWSVGGSVREEALAMGGCSTFGDHYLKMFLKGHPTSSINTGTEQVSSSWSGFMIACKQHEWAVVS